MAASNEEYYEVLKLLSVVIIAYTGNGHAILTHGPVHEILVLIAYAQMSLINTHSDVFSKTRCLNFGLKRHLHPYFVYTGSKGSGESAHIHKCADMPGLSLFANVVSTEIFCIFFLFN